MAKNKIYNTSKRFPNIPRIVSAFTEVDGSVSVDGNLYTGSTIDKAATLNGSISCGLDRIIKSNAVFIAKMAIITTNENVLTSRMMNCQLSRRKANINRKEKKLINLLLVTVENGLKIQREPQSNPITENASETTGHQISSILVNGRTVILRMPKNASVIVMKN